MYTNKWWFIVLIAGTCGCATVVNEDKAKAMNMLELCSSICQLSALTDEPPQEGQLCSNPNRFVIQQLVQRYPRTSLRTDELTPLSGMSIPEAAHFLQEGVSECAFLALMGLPRDSGSFYTTSDPDAISGNSDALYMPDASSSLYFYRGELGTLAYRFWSQNPATERKVLKTVTIVDNPSYWRGVDSGLKYRETDADGEVYLDGIRIPDSECIGAVIMGECKGTAVMPDRPGRKKCYGSIVGGKCTGAEF